jgi:hypothetical protein
MDSDRLAQIYVAENDLEAHFLKGLLEDNGIDVQIVNEALRFAIGDIPAGWATAPRLWVREENAVEARRLIDEWNAGRQERRKRGDVDEDDDFDYGQPE